MPYKERRREGEEETRLVDVLELDDARQVDESALHRVQALDNEEDFLPRAVRAGLTLRDALPEEVLEVVHVVVLVLAHHGARQARAEPDRRVVELVRDDEAPFAHEGRERRRVGRKAHRDDHRVLGAEELCDEALRLDVERARADVVARAMQRHTHLAHNHLGLVGAGPARLGKAEVVVRRYVERLRRLARKDKVVEVVGRRAVEADGGACSDARDRARKAVLEAELEAPRVERVKVGEQRRVAVARAQVRVRRGEQALADKVAQVAEDEQEGVWMGAEGKLSFGQHARRTIHNRERTHTTDRCGGRPRQTAPRRSP